MAQITFTVPNAQVPRIIATLPVVEGDARTDAQKIKDETALYWKDRVRAHELNQSRIAAEASVTDIDIT